MVLSPVKVPQIRGEIVAKGHAPEAARRSPLYSSTYLGNINTQHGR